MQDVFRFMTFMLQYVAYIAQFVLSLFKEPMSNGYSTTNATGVCTYALMHTNKELFFTA